jgi:hypothetical protein
MGTRVLDRRPLEMLNRKRGYDHADYDPQPKPEESDQSWKRPLALITLCWKLLTYSSN